VTRTGAIDGLETAWRVVVDGAEHGAYPGAVALVARGGEVLLCRAVGWAAVEPDRVPMTEATIFDLASLTKVVAARRRPGCRAPPPSGAAC
jgi:CubicO group peptidase (beta-lactamase class C family)